MSVIIIIDDNHENVRLAARLLSPHHQVMVANDGESGLTLVFDHQPDIALVDLGLPDIDGQTIIGMIRQNPVLAHMRVVAFTAYPEETAYEIARVYGCDGVIIKPIDTRVFVKQVEDILCQEQI
jgi:CheY-like chemotaxis protein